MIATCHMHRMSVILRVMSKPRNQARRLGAESKKNKKWNSSVKIDLRYVHYDLAGSHPDAPVRPSKRK